MKTVKEAIDFASELVKDVPEGYRVVAYPQLLRYSLGVLLNSSNIAKGFEIPKKDLGPLNNHSSEFSDLHLLAKKGSRDQHVAWAVAELFVRGEEVNNESIRKIIKEYLAITPPGRQNTNRSLRNITPKYIIRTKTNNKYYYVPSANLADVFENLKDEK